MNNSIEEEGKHIRTSIFISILISFIVGLAFVLQQFFNNDFCPGIYPLNWTHFYGVFLYPLFHSNLTHLLSNLPPLFFLIAGLFYYIPQKFFASIIYIWFGSAVFIWFFGRQGCHLGASGIIYGLAFMLATLGFLKKQRTLGAFALIIVFMYGSMVWGVLPQEGNISWEGHAGGAIIGILLAIIWQKEKIYTEEDNDPDKYENDNHENETTNLTNTSNQTILYHFKPN